MRLGIILASAFLLFTGLNGHTQQPGAKSTAPSTKTKMLHPHLHHALWALHHANHELHHSKEDYAGHKEKAEHAIHHAIKAIDAILTHEKDNHHPVPTKAELTEAHKKYKHHPHLHHAIHEVKEAHHQLKAAKDDYGGKRAKALHDMDHAVHQIELVLKHANAADKGKKGSAPAKTSTHQTTAHHSASTAHKTTAAVHHATDKTKHAVHHATDKPKHKVHLAANKTKTALQHLAHHHTGDKKKG